MLTIEIHVDHLEESASKRVSSVKTGAESWRYKIIRLINGIISRFKK